MGKIKAQLIVRDTPSPVMEDTSLAFYTFLAKINNYLKDTLFEEIDQLYVIILFNHDIAKMAKDQPVYDQGKSKLWVAGALSNEKHIISIQKATLIANLNPILNHYSDNTLIKKFDIILLYNADIEKIGLVSDPANTPKPNSPEVEDLTAFFPQNPKYSLDKVILNSELLNEIEATLLILENKKLIYEDWGFNEIELEPKAILNFHGPSGTGKTMTAHAIAHKLKLQILSLNYADIESKFVGVAPKNLVKAFEVAKSQNALLFFDEADSFLGKRIVNVTSNADQSVNSLRSQMLILLEDFNGLVILATNLLENYDKAFESRILKHLFFPLPDSSTRKKIILISIPKRVPYKDGVSLSENQIDKLVEISDGFSGRHIKNSILGALTNAIQSKRQYVIYDDFEKSFLLTAQNISDFNNSSSSSARKILSPEIKMTLEDKIKNHLDEK